MNYFLDKKLGILGGGQLGKMLCLEAARLDIKLHILDKDDSFPAAKLCHEFVEGDFTNYDDVLEFGMKMDIITIEIEKVNIEALKELERRGKVVYPEPSALEIIQDKGLQKDFYKERNIATSNYQHFESKAAIAAAVISRELPTPFVQKACREGYDGKGVQVIKSPADLDKLMDVKSIVEDLVDIDKEIAVIIARNPSEEIKSFPVVEMEFHPTANLVEYLCCPANISSALEAQAQKLAVEVIMAFDLHGILAIEMFLTKSGELLVNEVAPRPHNSGHHTLDAAYTSQFEQHLRAVLDLPLGSTSNLTASVMVNLLGEENYQGAVYYEGLDKAINVPGAHIMLYGKTETRPNRKMGHATVLAENVDIARSNANQLKQLLNIKTKN
jgi:5-(carboxyamino)imidazole ribonucleotide synthase